MTGIVTESWSKENCKKVETYSAVQVVVVVVAYHAVRAPTTLRVVIAPILPLVIAQIAQGQLQKALAQLNEQMVPTIMRPTSTRYTTTITTTKSKKVAAQTRRITTAEGWARVVEMT